MRTLEFPQVYDFCYSRTARLVIWCVLSGKFLISQSFRYHLTYFAYSHRSESSHLQLSQHNTNRKNPHLPKMASTLFLLSSSKYSDSLTVVGISICTAIVCEFISWLLIYRTSSYKSLKSSIDKASKKLETMKTTTTTEANNKSSKTKKIDRVETSLKESSRDLSMFKFKSGAVVALVLFMVFGLLNSLFEGKPVAKIPFVPIRLVQKMSHRGLPGDDMTDCSMAFLYLLCSISIRTNLQKFLGFSPPRGAAGAGFFPMPDPKTS